MPAVPEAWTTYAIITAAAGGAGLAVALVVRYFDRNRRRERAIHSAKAVLARGDWRAARDAAVKMLDQPNLDPHWQARALIVEGEAWYVGSEQAMAAGQYAEAVQLMRTAGERLGLPGDEAVRRVLEAMLAVLRRIVISDPTSPEIAHFVGQIRAIRPGCAEAIFWQGYGHLHRGEFDAARDRFAEAFESGGKQSADAAIYLGALAVRRGHHREAVRHLGLANRLAPACPVVGWQLGLALLGEGGDPLLAVRALQKAASPTGLAAFNDRPEKLWPESLPRDSWLGRLARRVALRCPIGLNDTHAGLNSARRMLGVAYLRAERFDDAAAAFQQAATAGDRDPVTLGGLGQSLVKLQRYADALPHLWAAVNAEPNPPARVLAAHALATARAARDHRAGVRAALGLIVSAKRRGDGEWAAAVAEIVADARAVAAPIQPAEVRELAAVFASVRADDAIAAGVYDESQPADDATGEIAALYLRAAVEHGFRGPRDGEWLGRAFRHRQRTLEYFEARDWKFDPAERLYLERWAETHAGNYPTDAGPDYAPIGEQVLLRESRQWEGRGRPTEARAAVELAHKLGPDRPATLDRLAELAYRSGDAGAALAHLDHWAARHPTDPRPLVRSAVIDYLSARPQAALTKLETALARSAGPERFRLVMLGARFALAAGKPERAAELFREAHQLDPHNAAPLAGLTCVAWLRGEMIALTALAPAWHEVRAEAPVFYFLAAVCHYLAGDCDTAATAVRHAASEPTLSSESKYLLGLIHVRGKAPADASTALRGAAAAMHGTARDQALAQLGLLAWHDGEFTAAARHWRSMDADRRHAWNLDRPLARAATGAGVAALRAGDWTLAADWFREARSFGTDEPRLNDWLSRALIGQARQSTDPTTVAVAEKSLAKLEKKPWLLAEMARAYRRLNRPDDARRLLDAAPSTSEVELQRGLCAVAEKLLPAAERHLSSAVELAPDSVAAALNLLFVRWSLGQAGTADWLDRVLQLPVPPKLARVLQLLRGLSREGPPSAELIELSELEEARLIAWLKKLGKVETIGPMLARLAAARPHSGVAARAVEHVETLTLKDWLDRGDPWSALASLPPARAERAPPVLKNLLGIAYCLVQEYRRAVACFQDALPDGDDARLRQNLAVALTWQGKDDLARIHWRRFVALAGSHCPAPPTESGYVRRLIELVRERLELETTPLPSRGG